MALDRDTYMQCPYCNYYKTEQGIRVPKTVGKYRIMIIHNKFLKFKCAKCAKQFKLILRDNKKIMWSKMTRKEKEKFKKDNYKGGKD